MSYSGTSKIAEVRQLQDRNVYSSTPVILITIKENNIQAGKTEQMCLRGKLMFKKDKRIREHRTALKKLTSPGPDMRVEFCVFFGGKIIPSVLTTGCTLLFLL